MGCAFARRFRRGCFAAGTLVMTGASSLPIEDVQLGQRVLTNIEQRSDDVTQREAFACPTEVDENWRRLTLILADPNEGPDFIAESLRSPEWMRSHHAEVGGTVWFELTELNIAGYARILEIDDAPLIEEGPGCVVLSRYTRVNDNLISLSLGDGDVLHLTDTHRLYSASRDQWVAAGSLWEGEYLRGAYATVPVDGLDWHEGAEPDFNLEVENAHRYLVGDAGVLAHNANNCKPGAVDAAGDGTQFTARRFMSKAELKQLKKEGVSFDPEFGNGIPTTTRNFTPKNQTVARQRTGAPNAEYQVDLDVTGVPRGPPKMTKSGLPEYTIQGDLTPDMIMSVRKVPK